eukprot:gene17742-biopygen6828
MNSIPDLDDAHEAVVHVGHPPPAHRVGVHVQAREADLLLLRQRRRVRLVDAELLQPPEHRLSERLRRRSDRPTVQSPLRFPDASSAPVVLPGHDVGIPVLAMMDANILAQEQPPGRN